MPSTMIVNLEKVPRTTDPYIWADYIELLALQNIDGEISRSDIIDRVKERQDFGETDELEQELNDPTRKPDRWSLAVSDWFLQLEYRHGEFNDSYPFTISKDRQLLRCRKTLTSEHKLYIFLLLAANLKNLSKNYHNQITAQFEIISLEALNSYLPKSSKTLLFGKNPLNDGQYSGKIVHKIHRLASELNEAATFREGDFDPRDSGDSGLDIVGYIPFNDKAGGMLIIYGQCACTLEWHSKQRDCDETVWDRIIQTTGHLTNMVFIPFCFRDAKGAWHRRLDIVKSIVIDRPRFLSLLRKKRKSGPRFSFPAVEAFLLTEETIF